MCGLSGYICIKGEAADGAALLRMNRALAHRGPDDEGYVLIRDGSGRPAEAEGVPSAEGLSAAMDFRGADTPPGVAEMPLLEPGRSFPHRIGMAHRRFSILGPGPIGHQPFWSPGRETRLVFNGEIYNYVELRSELEALGHRFLGHGDTEVLSAAYAQWGADCFAKCNGFWAAAIYDSRRGALLLARDRLGKAPLYWLRRNGRLWWSSEIKGLMAGLGTANLEIDSGALERFARSGSRDAGDGTFYADIRTFPKASYAWVEADGSFSPKTYWSLPRERTSEAELGPEEAVEGFRRALEDAVALRLRADVPLGVELSGGMDSSALAALAALKAGASGLRAYTVTFPGLPEDETPFARSLADAFPGRIDWRPVEYRAPDFFGRADGFVAHMDEPFHSPNMVANQDLWKVMAADGIKVSLNGGGGDEVLAGYASEYFGPYLVSLLGAGKVGRFMREFRLFSEHDPERLSLSYAREAFHLLPETWRRRLKPLIAPPDLDPLLPGPPGPEGAARGGSGGMGDIEARLIHNMGDGKMNYWMRSGNLSCMRVPTEVRLPFLDHKLVEYAFRLPPGYLIRDGWLKWILRRAMIGAVPGEVLWRRRKAGFPFPMRKWLAESAPRFRTFAAALDCPYLDGRKLAGGYDSLAASHPDYLWRLLSVGMWWHRCVQGRPLFREES